MQKRHFIAAANIIKSESDRAAAQKMADLIIAMNDNANFDCARFLSACGIMKDHLMSKIS
jgi:hypothetical protein